MIQIPPEFRENAHYFYAGRALESVNKPTAIVLYHVFADRCKEIAEEIKSPDLMNFIEIYSSKLPPFPDNGTSEALFVANELYGALYEKIESGILNTKMNEQFSLCSTLYSILEGEFCMLRETKCRILASKFQILINQMKDYYKNEPLNAEIESEKEAKEIPQEECKKPEEVEIPKIIPQPTLGASYNVTAINEYLDYMGCDRTQKIPKCSETMRPLVQKYIDLGTSCIKRGDKKTGLNYLQRAKKAWTTGKEI